MKKTLIALALALATGAAQAIPLSALLAGDSLTAGDKLFADWRILLQGSSDPNRTVNTDNIEVTTLEDGGLDPGPGLSFAIKNDEFTVTGDGIYAYLDFQFGFSVTVLDPKLRVKDNTLAITTAYVASPDGLNNTEDLGMTIVEEILNVQGNQLGIKTVEFSYLSGLATFNISDRADFAPQDKLWVTKNILVWATRPEESAGLVGFEQRFSQTTVPEPATLGLLALGLAGLGLARLRKMA